MNKHGKVVKNNKQLKFEEHKNENENKKKIKLKKIRLKG